MEILVVAATEMEIAAYTKEEPAVDFLITGVGAPACLYRLMRRLSDKRYDYIIQAGIAGSFRTVFAPGETVVVKQDLFADLGIYEKDNFFTLFERGFADKHELPFTNSVLLNAAELPRELPAVNAITVNTVSDLFWQKDLYAKKYAPDIETMEGAAFHYVCLMENIPFLQLRSISNYVGERLKTNWKMKESLESLNINLEKIVNSLQQ